MFQRLLKASLFLLPASCFADTATANLTVSATVLKVCIVSTTPLAFGNYNASSGSPNDATATVSVTCNNGTTYEIGLNAGSGTGATTTARKMTYLANTVNYQLFRDTGRSQNWGNSAGSDTVSGSGTGSAANHTIFGRIPTGQYSTVGAYEDTVTITVTY